MQEDYERKLKRIIWEVNGTPAALPNKALERNAQSFMKRTIVACIGLGDEHQDNVSLIGRLSWGRYVSASRRRRIVALAGSRPLPALASAQRQR